MSAILYIQMEYCQPETLRDVINMGVQNDPQEGYRLFRQILQGLAHIHAFSIVHRDLKPENVFIDDKGDVRIGDFGLARPGDFRHPSFQGAEYEANFGNFTQSVGTASYIAPEVQSSGGGKYNEKADMYSLGIIFLEMNVAFSTGMERAESLDLIQKGSQILPKALEVPDRQQQAILVRSLVQQKPSARPSSIALLKSDQIPMLEEDATLRSARRLVMDPKSQLRKDFLASLFANEVRSNIPRDPSSQEQSVSQKMILLDDVSAMSRQIPQDLELQTMVKRKLTSIYRRHGAVERTDSPVLIPYHANYSAHDVYLVLDQGGKILQLPYDLVLPNAMLLAQRGSASAKRTYTFGNVYRSDGKSESLGIFGETTFDIIGGDSDDLALQDAEIIKTLDEILDTFPNLNEGPMCYHLSHSHVLDAILEFAAIDRETWNDVKNTLSKLHTSDWTWAKVRYELKSLPLSVPSMSLDELERFDFRGPLPEAIARVKGLIRPSKWLEKAYAYMETVAANSIRLGIRRKIYMNPLSTYNEKFYRGNLLFQCIHDLNRRTVFAAGGRYDHLVQEHQPIAIKANRIHIAGFQLTWSGLTTGLARYLKTQVASKSKGKSRVIEKASWRSRRCDVVVDSFDLAMIPKTGLDVLRELWASDISAELADEDLGVPTEYTRVEDTKGGHGWIVTIKSENLVKVRNTWKKEESEMRPSDLANHIRNEMRERERDEGRSNATIATLQRFPSAPEGKGNGAEHRDVEVKVLTSNNKGKKTNRKNVVEDALSRAQEWGSAASDLPIIAIETKDNVFNAIDRITKLDAEAWKKVIQDVPAGERGYLNELLELLESYVEKHPAVFLYNFRTKQISYHRLLK